MTVAVVSLVALGYLFAGVWIAQAISRRRSRNRLAEAAWHDLYRKQREESREEKGTW